MLKNFFIARLIQKAQKEHPHWYRALNLIGTIGFVFLFFPFLYVYTGRYLERYINIPIDDARIDAIAMLALCVGGMLIMWTLMLQYKQGQGSGSHMVPTKKLIVQGPYGKTRHPMLLGSVLFYFGICTLMASLMVGLYAALTTALLAYFFALYIEEPVLVARFGKQYQRYSKKIPPFLPCLPTCSDDCDGKHKPGN